jgi:hypothetical protein
MNPVVRNARLYSAALLLAALATRPALAQEVAPAALAPGATLRLTMVGSDLPLRPAENRRITLIGADTATFWVSGLTRGKPDTIAYKALLRMEVRARAYPRHTVILLSALSGAVFELAAVKLDVWVNELDTKDPVVRRATIRYPLRGLGWGALLGVALSRERWHEVTGPLRVTSPADSTR